MKKTFYLFTVVVSLAFTGWRAYLLFDNYRASKRPPPPPAIPDTLGTPVVLQGADLVVIAAHGRLGNLVGETVQVEADVVRRTNADELEAKSMGGTLFCKYVAKEAPEAGGLNPKDRVVVTGRVYGYLADRLWLKVCRFAPRTTALEEGWEIIKTKP